MKMEHNPHAIAFDPTLPLERASTPPAWWYRSPERELLERREVLCANWQVVAHRDEVLEPGAYVSGCSGQEPWVVIRDEEGALRAFANVCRHNGTQVAQGNGRTEKLVCPYHGWTYHLDGSLATAPRIGGIKDFDRDAYSLAPLQVREFGPLILLNITGDAEPLILTSLEDRLETTGWTTLKRLERRSYPLQCNWKVFIDNYLDGGYHVPFLHADLAANLDLGALFAPLGR